MVEVWMMKIGTEVRMYFDFLRRGGVMGRVEAEGRIFFSMERLFYEMGPFENSFLSRVGGASSRCVLYHRVRGPP